MVGGYTLAMDNNHATKFYAQKAETLTKVRDSLQLAVNDLWQLRLTEEKAPAGDLSEVDSIFAKLTETHEETCALLDAVKAMLP